VVERVVELATSVLTFPLLWVTRRFTQGVEAGPLLDWGFVLANSFLWGLVIGWCLTFGRSTERKEAD
jgi:hypothetical protein